MAAIFMDGFDHYGTGDAGLNNMKAGFWAAFESSNPSINAPSWGPARTGDYCLRSASRNTGWSRRVLPTPLTHMFMSFGFAVDSLPSSSTNKNGICVVLDGSNNELYYLALTTTGALQIKNGSTVLATTSGPVITAQTWHFLEMEINTAGNWVVRVDDATASGTPALTATLSGGTIAQLGFLNVREAATTPDSPRFYIDDLFVRDTTGSVNNSWIGDRRVAALFVNDDTETAGWSPSYYYCVSPGIGRFAYTAAGETDIGNPTTGRIATAGATALDLGAEFTLETFARMDRLPTGSEYFTLFNRWNEDTTNGRSYRLLFGSDTYNGGNLEFQTSTDGTGATAVVKLSYPWEAEADRWYHIALVRSAGELLLFIDGQQMGLPIADSDTYHPSSTSVFAIGGHVNSSTNIDTNAVSGSVWIGRMDETRITNGVARYTANFTPTTEMFPRNVVDDPDWASVVLLLGYDSGILDESSYARTLDLDDTTSVIPDDGPAFGPWSTIGTTKTSPDNNTFIYAKLTAASNILTLTTNPTDSTTVTVGTTDGSTPAVYTFKTVLASAFDVLIGATAQDTLENLMNAINAGTGEGTTYGTGTTSNVDVEATSLPDGQIMVTALIAGAAGNSIAVATTSTASWEFSSTLEGGEDIPGPSIFKVSRPPSNTTLVSAVQITVRAEKTDAGVGTIRTGLVGPLGGLDEGVEHPLTINTIGYLDMFETDPDTSGPLSPTTIINGGIRINRTA